MDLPTTPAAPEIVIADAVCPACCCLCDDIQITVRENRVAGVANACIHGRNWFLAGRKAVSQPILVDGRPALLDAAIGRAAELLLSARYPLVYVLPEMSSEAMRLAAAVADRLGAVLDTATSSGHAPSILGFQNAGKVTCTLGETRNRASMIVFWGTNVLATYPRFFTRYSAEAAGMFVPRGRADRYCVAIDVCENETTRAVDTALQLRPGADFEAVAALRALVKGLPLDALDVKRQTGVPLSAWSDLAERMKQARFGSIVFGHGLMQARGRHANCEALFRLVAELNDHTRFICRSIRGSGNITGGDKVCTWRTGFPFGINLARGYPRYSPGEYTAQEILERGETDAALIVGGDPFSRLGPAAIARLRAIPRVVVANSLSAHVGADVAIHTATHGLHTAGTMYRMDDIPLAIRPALASTLPSESDVLGKLQTRLSVNC